MNISLRFTHILKKGRIYSSDLGFVCSLWLPNESGSVDPHIFANPDTDSGAKMLRIQRIWILSTAFMILFIIKEEENPCRTVSQNPPEH